MSNTIDLNQFNGTVLTKTFTVPDRVLKNKKYVKFGLNCPIASYAILENGRIYIKTITSGQEYNGGMYNKYFSYSAELTDEVRAEISSVQKKIDSPENRAAIEMLAENFMYTSKSFKQQLSARINSGDIKNGDSIAEAFAARVSSQTKIMHPHVEVGRSCENSNKSTFDFVTVTIRLCYSFAEAKAYVMEHHSELRKMAADAIANSTTYKKHGVPTSFLKLDSVILAKDCTLHFSFSLKEA